MPLLYAASIALHFLSKSFVKFVMPIQSISAQQALEMQAQGALVLDVREPWELEIAAIDHALNIPMQTIPLALDALPREQALLIICHHGIRSMQVARFLEQQGFDDLFNVAGGTDAWSRTVNTALPRY
jgi:rhodanese-related sulfurtransferase